MEPEHSSMGWEYMPHPWSLAQTHVVLSEALSLEHGQLKTWLFKGLGTAA